MPCVAVVDDSAAVRNSLALLLTSRGYFVNLFEGAGAVLEVFRHDLCDCYVIDFKLEGLDGIGLLRALRGLGATQPAILISGWEYSGLEALAAHEGFDGFIRKPMLKESIVPLLVRVMRQGGNLSGTGP
jgi:two-component system response regulator FixJ